VEGDPSALHLDMNVSTNRIVGEELRELIERGEMRAASDAATGKVLPSVEGLIRVKADELTFAGFTWSPLRAAISLASPRVSTRIERGEVCGISTVGTFDAAGGELRLDLMVSATDGSLDATTVCLTQSRRMSGVYSLRARLTGRGASGQVGRTLSGEFEFSARDGQFLQSPTVETVLESTFDYLNSSGDFEIAFPDLHRESFPFRLANARGRIEGLTLVLDEVVSSRRGSRSEAVAESTSRTTPSMSEAWSRTGSQAAGSLDASRWSGPS